MRWLSGVDHSPETVFLTHGEEESALALADRITRERGFETHVPEPGESWELDGRSG
jgi:metallo-beta-lactamase family protein